MSLCECVADHNPEPANHARHHILPRSWGGSDNPTNLVWLCPTGHENVHTLLNQYVRLRDVPPWKVRRRFGPLARQLAHRAWTERGEKIPYTLVPRVDTDDCRLEEHL